MLFKTKLNCMFVKMLCYQRKVVITMSVDPLFMLTIETFLDRNKIEVVTSVIALQYIPRKKIL